MSTTTESWIDLVPAWPINDDVPVTNGSRSGVAVDDGKTVRWHKWGSDPIWEHPDLRIDLDHHWGFGYALQELIAHGMPPTRDIVTRHLARKTTGADKVWVAKALYALLWATDSPA